MSLVLSILTYLVIAIVVILVVSAIYTRILIARVERENPPSGKVTRVTGGSIHWTESGSGAPVVLIHGLSGNLFNFSAIVPLLSNEFRVISIDRPGCGYSSRDSEASADVEIQASMIAEFLDKEGINNPTIVGHSLGGAVTLTLALANPKRINAIALLSPATYPEKEPPAAFKPLDIANLGMRRFVGATLAAPIGQLQTRKLLTEVYKPEPVPADFIDTFDKGLSSRGSAFVAASGDLHGAANAIQELNSSIETLETPGGILFGDEDAILDADCNGKNLAKRSPKLEYENLPSRGHMIPMTLPDVCADFIKRMHKRGAE